jgi:hypothetical protein
VTTLAQGRRAQFSKARTGAGDKNDFAHEGTLDAVNLIRP